MLEEIEAVFERYEEGGAVTIRYDSRVYVGRL
jgi:hypothetical protein